MKISSHQRSWQSTSLARPMNYQIPGSLSRSAPLDAARSRSQREGGDRRRLLFITRFLSHLYVPLVHPLPVLHPLATAPRGKPRRTCCGEHVVTLAVDAHARAHRRGITRTAPHLWARTRARSEGWRRGPDRGRRGSKRGRVGRNRHPGAEHVHVAGYARSTVSSLYKRNQRQIRETKGGMAREPSNSNGS